MDSVSHKLPQVTVITVCFNSEATIRDAIDSVIRQKYENIEYIIIDGGSEDRTVEIAREYGNSLAVFSEPDDGIYDAFNKGLKLAKGDIIHFLNSDDFYHSENSVSRAVETFLKDKVDMVFMRTNIIESKSKKLRRVYPSIHLSRYDLERGFMPPHPGSFIKYEIYDALGDFDVSFNICGDYEYFCRIAACDKWTCSSIDDVGVSMREGGISSSGAIARLRLNIEVLRALRINGFSASPWRLLIKYVRKIREFI